MRLWIIPFVVLFITKAFSQDTIIRSKNAVYVEGLGTGLFISGHYERVIINGAGAFISSKIGVGYVMEPGYVFDGLSVTPGIFLNIGERKSFFELGLTGIYLRSYYEEIVPFGPPHNYLYKGHNDFLVAPSVGYKFFFRRQLLFKIYYCPLIYLKGDALGFDRVLPLWGGIAMGYAF